MTLWKTKEEMEEFSNSGAHLKAMQKINHISQDFVTVTIDSYNLIPWREAVVLLEQKSKSKKSA
ncbi:hypothetical protein [Phaeocystidibacter luteus]|uniref:DUF3291 domain-containing protein n=1 Tax=Phaeocystidibacter luteus TaxID=911197 RepID=A0A6N6RHC5_9FLAO|nr:hypothetical protein [Phaeocystidibacter luteus]KAB2809870.1 hypothetical protein F8C67_08275 [Phaeocystidibacter luteus]